MKRLHYIFLIIIITGCSSEIKLIRKGKFKPEGQHTQEILNTTSNESESAESAVDYSPEVKMTLVNTRGTSDKGASILAGKTLVKVELDEQDKKVFQNQQFEIVFFLDYEFYAEDEAGYTPFNWVWDLTNVEEGEHLLTVNISSFKDQIGVLSRKVKVVKE